MRRPLTDRAIAALKPAPVGKRLLLHDSVVPGFAAMVTDKGAKSFVLVVRFPKTGKPARRFIGKVGALSLASARAKAQQWRELIAEGKDPAEHEAAQQRAAARRRANSFEVVAEAFIEARVRAQRTAHDTEREIRKHLIARWGSRPITDITVDDIVDLCDDFRRAGIRSHARNILGHARRLFRWAIERRCYDMVRSPCEGLSPTALIGERVPRDRVLGDTEIRALWLASEKLGYPYGAFFRMVLLTGTRRDQASDAQWREFDLERRLWVIPPARVKQRNTGKPREHIVPLSKDAAALLDSVPRFASGDFLFSTTAGAKSVDGFSKGKLRLDGAMQTLLGDTALEPFVIHDIRRTMRSRLSELGVSPIVAEVTIGHSLPGLLGVYDRFEYLNEKRDALERWAARLRQIVNPQPNVVPMRGVS